MVLTGFSKTTKGNQEADLFEGHAHHVLGVLNWAVPTGTRVNESYYQWVICKKLRPAIRKKRRKLHTENGVIFLHDNAHVHVTRSLLDMLDAWD